MYCITIINKWIKENVGTAKQLKTTQNLKVIDTVKNELSCINHIVKFASLL